MGPPTEKHAPSIKWNAVRARRPRAYGWRNEEAIGATTSFGKRHDLSAQRALKEITQTSGRRHSRSVRTRWAVLLSFVPIVLAILVGMTVGATAGWITLGVAYMPLMVLSRFVDVR